MYKNVLLPADGLGKCAFGTCHGILFAKALGAKITAVCITKNLPVDEIKKLYDEEVMTASSVAEVVRGVKERTQELHEEMADKSLEVAQKMCAENGVACDEVHVSGLSPADAVLKVAEDKGCDCIFISTHGNPGYFATLYGTVAAKLMEECKRPVLAHYCGGPD